ncbi:hypothetical protein [Streptomyces sp. ST2-7A]|uniref:hypothetical protein n=1 Tax=Streptomyces sp. ST2-7A TaxID=2907214 RepID=UPI001F1754FD|nr:hypothetical protein [Streptomyces sp. ST2-7A]MCE7080669.1 hypothetical protein [Streptomyces sp. ST2-7A]
MTHPTQHTPGTSGGAGRTEEIRSDDGTAADEGAMADEGAAADGAEPTPRPRRLFRRRATPGRGTGLRRVLRRSARPTGAAPETDSGTTAADIPPRVGESAGTPVPVGSAGAPASGAAPFAITAEGREPAVSESSGAIAPPAAGAAPGHLEHPPGAGCRPASAVAGGAFPPAGSDLAPADGGAPSAPVAVDAGVPAGAGVDGTATAFTDAGAAAAGKTPAVRRGGGVVAAARLPMACLLAGALLGAGWSLLSEPRYTSRAHVVVPVGESGDHARAVGMARIHGRLAVEPVVLERAAATLGVPVAELRGRVRSATSPDAPVVEITATDTDPVRAAGTADAVAGALVAHGAELAAPETGGAVPAPLPLAGARPASAPTSPSLVVATGAGACAGVIVGVLPGRLRGPRERRGAAPGPGASRGIPGPVSGTTPASVSVSLRLPGPGTVPGPVSGARTPAVTGAATTPPPRRRRRGPGPEVIPALPRGHRFRRGRHERR